MAGGSVVGDGRNPIGVLPDVSRRDCGCCRLVPFQLDEPIESGWLDLSHNQLERHDARIRFVPQFRTLYAIGCGRNNHGRRGHGIMALERSIFFWP